nr:MAG: putative RNA-dependent RNA polymerase [Narnaviridae sp.]
MPAGDGAPGRLKNHQHRRPLVRGPRVPLAPLQDVYFEESKQPTTMGTSTFWKKCNEALCDTFSLYGLRFERVLVEKCEVAKDVSSLVKYLKTWVAIWLPMVLSDDLPPNSPEDPYEILAGPFKTFWRNRMTGKGKTRRIILASLVLYSKRLFPALPQDVVVEKLESYYEGLQRPCPKIYPFKHDVLSSITQCVDEIGDMVADYSKPFAPSTSSCLEATRKEGGLQGYARSHLLPSLMETHPFLKSVENIVDKMSNDDLALTNWKAVWYDLLGYLLEKADNQMLHSCDFSGEMTDDQVDHIQTILNESDQASDIYSDSWARMEAMTTGIPEPLKVRLVTKQSWVLSMLQPIQKAWHSKMRQHPIYQLIGGVPVDAALSGLQLEKGQKFVSGDYEAATDNIHLWCTQHAAEAMLERTTFVLPEHLKKFEKFLRRLALHSLISVSVKGIPVVRGQMMGHILSFPLLCLINRAVTVLAVPRNRFMRVNGDDILFPASNDEYQHWKLTTAFAGLKFSLGKNYYSRDIATVNSEIFVWSKEHAKLTRVQVPNVGLLGYQNDIVDRETGRQILPWEQYGTMWEAFEKTVHPKNWKAAYNLFKKRYPGLSAFPGPLLGPRELGGLGGRVPSGWTFSRTELMWMEAHRKGEFDFREGIHSDYSRIQDRFGSLLSKENTEIRFGLPPGRITGPPPPIVPDPYARGGGYAERIMALRRWVVKTQTLKKSMIFGRRRWNRFLHDKPGGSGLLAGSSLASVTTNTWSSHRRRWYLVRHHQREYEDDASLLHLIFPGH